jgi:DNA-binding beta-propeller fold protein YncE
MPDHRAAVDGVSAYWDALVLGQETTGINLDPDVAEAIRRFQALGAAPPSTARERVWQTVQAAAAMQRESEEPMQPSVVLDRSRPLPSSIRPGAVPLPWRGRSHWLLAQLATAALLVLTLVASFLVFGPARIHRGSEAPAVLPAIGATPATLDATDAPVAEFLWQTTGGPDLPLGDPYRIALDPAGNLWIPDSNHHLFQIFAPDGTFLETWGTEGSDDGQFNFVLAGYGYGAVVWDADGTFYVADSGNYRIQKFSPDRTFIAAWGSQGGDDGQFMGLDDLALDQQGRLVATDHERDDIQVFDTDGHFLAVWGAPGMKEGQFMNPGGLAVDADGNLYVSEGVNHRIQKLAPDGTVLASWGMFGTDEGEFDHPSDVMLDAEGRLFVTEWANNRIQVFDAEGRFLTAWGEPGSEGGQFRGPIGTVLDADGGIYVSEDGNDRVQKLRLLPPLAPE